MTPAFGNILIRVNAGFLILASAGGLITDVAGSFFGRGAEAALLADAPGAGIGFIEAHGLALIIGLTMWRIAYSVNWHAFLATVHALLGTANLLFWQFFIAADVLVVGYVTTAAHWLFVVAHLGALAGAARLAAPSR
ncbi:MAG: hypothetical protein EOS23_32240 [Mesorhizobium sp.]|uniref:hypothetical protein n=1 Tax=unclassified Mesorhizobium TaxID=325217 RepID=UPI0007ECD2A7|nr:MULTISPECIES: hypothetical protein [unclassified Mesorhizobium]QIA24167.1 hypothetical protein A9K68_022015 [Mesorhizobium sp. AA22]RWD39989.1 MAG: hypothetical protein EOS59_31255 [Mesorhizobium sp.]RWE06023.1 MAG: hypothetical protein EOS23_32240 [Mesorhizobium sp.]RWE51356.1 MAG: hypothetical protein EOS24_33025 [Mesorhizobium sp.]RWE81242.1 MAG: hypothetical protein EOS49_30265 [Mesorhizobium sp.]